MSTKVFGPQVEMMFNLFNLHQVVKVKSPLTTIFRHKRRLQVYKFRLSRIKTLSNVKTDVQFVQFNHFVLTDADQVSGKEQVSSSEHTKLKSRYISETKSGPRAEQHSHSHLGSSAPPLPVRLIS